MERGMIGAALLLFWVGVILLTAGCTTPSVQVGISAHTPGADRPEIQGMGNPLGIVRGAWGQGFKIEGFCEHISSIPVWEQGYGLNHCGVLWNLK